MKTKITPEMIGRQDFSTLVKTHEASHRRNTQGVNHALVQHMESFCGHAVPVPSIDDNFCRRFANYLAERVSASSARTYLHKLHAMLEHAVELGLAKCNPMPPVRTLLPPPAGARRTYLLREELSRLADTSCCHDETKRAFLFACQTGLRLSDIETLEWSDIVDNGESPTIVKTQVKTGREVRVPLNKPALNLLGEHASQGKVFRLPSRPVISTDLKEWSQRAGLAKHLTFHVSRHTFATLAIAAGVDIYVVSKLCGHAAVRTTETYAHMADSTLKRGVTLLGTTMTSSRRQSPLGHAASWLHRIDRLVGRLARWSMATVVSRSNL